MKKVILGLFLITFLAPLSLYAGTVISTGRCQGNNPGESTTVNFFGTFNSSMSVGATGVVGGRIYKDTDAGFIPCGNNRVVHACPSSGCLNFIETSPGYFDAIGGPCQFPEECDTTQGTFVAPTTPGRYYMGFRVQAGINPSIGVATIDVIGAQCSDSLNNDNAEGADQADPQCHTDCNVNNPGSYVPTHDSETTPPNGSCPAPATLNLNGRSAFIQVVKNFFASITAKAFAGE